LNSSNEKEKHIMDYTKVLKRAWQILWRYRALWLFGFILALTTVSYRSPIANFNFGSSAFDRPSLRNTLPEDYKFPEGFYEAIDEFSRLIREGIPPDVMNTMIAIGIGLGVFILLLVIVGKILRYLSETALIRMVDEYEKTDKSRSIRYGFRIGWSRTAWRLFLIDLAIDFPVILIILLLLAVVIAPFLLWAFGEIALGVVATIVAIGFFFLLILLVIVIGIALGMLKPFFRRVCALDGLSAIAAIRKGYLVVRQNFKDVAMMWVILFGIKIGWGILMIPVSILSFILAVILGGATALGVGALTGLFSAGAQPWIFAVVAGFPIFLVAIVLPIAFLNGLKATFISSTWTLTYREITSFESLEIKELPEPRPPNVEEKLS
jgi:hypothetical protein